MAESGPGPGDTPVGGSRRPSRPPRSAFPTGSPADTESGARETWPRVLQPAVEKSPDDACPWLYLHADPDARAAFVTADHRCEIRPDEVPGPGHQLAYCLTTNHISCPQLRSYEARRRAAADAVRAQEPPSISPPSEPQPQTAAAEFRTSLLRGVGTPPERQRGSTPLARIAWAAAGAVGALLFVAGIALYSAPDSASSDPAATATVLPSAAVVTSTPAALASKPTATPTLAAGPTPVGSELAAGAVSEALRSSPSPTPAPTSEPTPEPPTYIVRPGDTLGQIAQNLGISVVALAIANDMTTDTLIFVGDRLFLPPAETAAPTATPLSPSATPEGTEGTPN